MKLNSDMPIFRESTMISAMACAKIKRRESFRPFAPSILSEHVSDWFELDEPVPFMEKVFPIKPERHAEIPVVTHVDGSGRL